MLYLRNGQKLTKGNVDGKVAFNQGNQDFVFVWWSRLKNAC
ncbi:MAG: hypothetical protein RL040_108 [Bacteroidota bacterium]|jgi:hypothetical protein